MKHEIHENWMDLKEALRVQILTEV